MLLETKHNCSVGHSEEYAPTGLRIVIFGGFTEDTALRQPFAKVCAIEIANRV